MKNHPPWQRQLRVSITMTEWRRINYKTTINWWSIARIVRAFDRGWLIETFWILCQAIHRWLAGRRHYWETEFYFTQEGGIEIIYARVTMCMHVCLSRWYHRIHSNVLDFLSETAYSTAASPSWLSPAKATAAPPRVISKCDRPGKSRAMLNFNWKIFIENRRLIRGLFYC